MKSMEKFPCIGVSTIEAGTDMLKIGSESGLTFGKFMGLANHSFIENGIKHHVENAVTIQWIPGMPFALSGDSESIYYACRGSFRYPIAIHRGKVKGQ